MRRSRGRRVILLFQCSHRRKWLSYRSSLKKRREIINHIIITWENETSYSDSSNTFEWALPSTIASLEFSSQSATFLSTESFTNVSWAGFSFLVLIINLSIFPDDVGIFFLLSNRDICIPIPRISDGLIFKLWMIFITSLETSEYRKFYFIKQNFNNFSSGWQST